MGGHRHRTTLGGELQRVGHQIEDDLLDRPAVGVDLHGGLRKDAAQVHPGAVGLDSQKPQGGGHRFPGVECFQGQLETLGFDL